jgi:hypothetical protein
MSYVTFILTRRPLQEFVRIVTYGKHTDDEQFVEVEDMPEAQREELYLSRRQIAHLHSAHPTKADSRPTVAHLSGRWGSLAVVVGPKVGSAWSPTANFNDPADGPGVGGGQVRAAKPDAAVKQMLAFAGQNIALMTDGGAIEKVHEYETMERFRSDLGPQGGGGFVMLHPRPEPYPLRFEPGNKVVKTLRTGHSGDCIRVLGGTRKGEDGILIHEAPDIVWLTGCISPRPRGMRAPMDNEDGNPSFNAMKELFAIIGGGTPANQARLYVLDW